MLGRGYIVTVFKEWQLLGLLVSIVMISIECNSLDNLKVNGCY